MITDISYHTSGGKHTVVYQYTVGDKSEEVRLPFNTERSAKAVLRALTAEWSLGDINSSIVT